MDNQIGNPIIIPKKVPHKPEETITSGHSIAGSEVLGKPAPLQLPIKKVIETTEPDLGLSSLRTYKQDVTELMRREKTSLVQMVLQEQRAKQREKEISSPKKARSAVAVSAAVFLIIISVVLLYLVFFHDTPSPEKTIETLNIHPIISAEKNKEITIDISLTEHHTWTAVLERIRNDKLTLDNIEYIFFTEKVSLQTKDGIIEQKNVVSTGKFFDFINVEMPSFLKRALGEEFMFGIHAFNGNVPFFILTTNYYDNAFAGMLEWERYMARTLLPFFGKQELAKELSDHRFQDMVIKNKDVRALTDSQGNIALIYAFKNEHTLIITTSEDTLIELSRRLDLSRGKK